MCGRFSLHLTDLAAIASALGISLPEDDPLPAWEPRYNVAPTQQVPVAVAGETPALTMSRWGLVPHWAKDLGVGARAINARWESAADKPTFRDAWASRRCVVPATGYFEWKKLDGKRKQPTWIHPSDGSILRMAGLWSRWHPPGGGEPVHTFTVLTQPARGVVEAIHDRMPVELSDGGARQWLSATRGAEHAAATLRKGTRDTAHLTTTAVSEAVNSPRNDSAAILEPATVAVPARTQLSLDELFGTKR